jgi:hypothetical protein
MNRKKKRLKVLVCYTAMEKYYLPVEAKTYRQPGDDKARNAYTAIEAYMADHECKPDKEDSDDWQIASVEEVE